jgi:hypothetical protein
MGMLRFAIVFSPLNWEPGLEPDHVPDRFDIEDALGRGVEEFPYGDAGINKPPVKPEKKKKKIIVGIDFDGTVTSEPRAFSDITNRIMLNGDECHLITGRPKSEASKVKQFCDLYNIKFSSMKFYPKEYKYMGPNPMVDADVAVWKGAICKDLGAHIMIDDNYVYAMAINKANPNIVIVRPMVSL